MTPRFGLPPGVDDRARTSADVFVIPHPRFGVDGLTHGAQNTQGAQVMSSELLCAPLHERSDCCRSGVELGHAVTFDDVPEAVLAPARAVLA